MIYNEAINYNSSNVTYNGTLIINAPSLANPIILNNIVVFYATNEDFSNFTTIAVSSIDITGNEISVEALDDQVEALASASIISISGDAEITIIA